jgi:predicted nucleotidyltransferase
MDKKQIEKVIKTYLKDLSNKIKIEKVILFGSALRGKMTEDSDIDLLIVSPSFSKMSINERFDLLYTSRINPLTQKVAMDIFGLSPTEYQEASVVSIVGEIKETGREVLVK